MHVFQHDRSVVPSGFASTSRGHVCLLLGLICGAA
jgi:hypothetical protein